MTSHALYRKWRSQTFAEVVGQDAITATLRNAVRLGRIAHAYLFCGPRGSGKTSTARIFAKAVNCLAPEDGEPCNRCQVCRSIAEGRAMDLIEIDAASNRGIEEARSIRDKVAFAPTETRYKVYVVDEVHQLTDYAFNALLKTLEEPPPHSIFILATTEAHKLPATVISRCQRYDFRRIPLQAAVGRLSLICQREDLRLPPEGLSLIAKASGGSLRDAENTLDQLVACYGPDISLAQVQQLLGATGDQRVAELAGAVVARNLPRSLEILHEVAADGLDLRQFGRELVDYARGLLLHKVNAGDLLDEPAEVHEAMAALVAGVPASALVRLVKLLSQVEPRPDGPPTLPLELALVEAALEPEATARLEAPEAPRRAGRGPHPGPLPVAERASPRVAGHLDSPRPPASGVAARPDSARPVRPEPVEDRAGRGPAAAVPPESPERVPPIEDRMEEAALAPAPPGSVSPPGGAVEPAGHPGPGAARDGDVGDPVSVEALRARWAAILDALRGVDKTTEALLRSCDVYSVQDSVLVVACYYPYHKEKLDDPRRRAQLQKAVKQVVGHDVQVRCTFVPRDPKAKNQDVVDDPLVREAIRLFEAKSWRVE